jgi:hypothetical protein
MKPGMEFSRLFLFIAGLFLLIGFSSCSMTFEKRHYRKGYHIEMVKTQYQNTGSTDQRSVQLLKVEAPVVKLRPNGQQTKESKLTGDEIHGSKNIHTERYRPVINTKNIKKISSGKINPNADCDVITLKDGTQIDAMIENIGEDYITYRKCNFESGPSYTLSMNKVEMIHLRNGDYYKPKANLTTNNSKSNAGKGNGMGELVIGILAVVFSLFALIMSFLTFTYGAATLAFIFGPFGFILGIIGVILTAIKLNPDNHANTIPALVLAGLAILFFMVAIAVLVLL